MNLEQLEQAQKKTRELLEYHRKTDQLKIFIANLEDTEYIRILTSHQYELWKNEESALYELFGTELVEILKKKLQEREEYIDKLDADYLVLE